MTRRIRESSYAELVEVLTILPILVREKRRRLGLSLRGASKQIGVSFSTVTRFEGGEDISLGNAILLLEWVSQP